MESIYLSDLSDDEWVELVVHGKSVMVLEDYYLPSRPDILLMKAHKRYFIIDAACEEQSDDDASVRSVSIESEHPDHYWIYDHKADLYLINIPKNIVGDLHGYTFDYSKR